MRFKGTRHRCRSFPSPLEPPFRAVVSEHAVVVARLVSGTGLEAARGQGLLFPARPGARSRSEESQRGFCDVIDWGGSCRLRKRHVDWKRLEKIGGVWCKAR